MRWILSGFIGLLAVITVPAAALAEPRVALIIGNDHYSEVRPLANAVADANLVAHAAQSLGFEVILRSNATRREIIGAFTEFQERLGRAGPRATVLFYFAGHGVQISGRNFLLPTEAEPNEVSIRNSAVDFAIVVETVAAAGTHRNIIILDACRNNPFGVANQPRARGLAELDARSGAPSGSLIAFATAPGSTAADGTGANGPYAAALSEALQTPGFTVEDVFRQAAARVAAETGDAQTPWTSSSLLDRVVLLGGNDDAGRAAYDVATEAAAWRRIAQTRDIDDLSWFLNRFPSGANSARAQARMEQLRADAARVERDTRGQNAGYGVVMRHRTHRGPLGERPALEVVSVDSNSRFFGELLPGDFVFEINHEPVTQITSPAWILTNRLATARRVDLLVRRGAASYQVVVELR